jgi:hypothetical protein
MEDTNDDAEELRAIREAEARSAALRAAHREIRESGAPFDVERAAFKAARDAEDLACGLRGRRVVRLVREKKRREQEELERPTVHVARPVAIGELRPRSRAIDVGKALEVIPGAERIHGRPIARLRNPQAAAAISFGTGRGGRARDERELHEMTSALWAVIDHIRHERLRIPKRNRRLEVAHAYSVARLQTLNRARAVFTRSREVARARPPRRRPRTPRTRRLARRTRPTGRAGPKSDAPAPSRSARALGLVDEARHAP